ncbi:uncharacterized protein A4U43_C01F20120 [Asparagus officinalis]|uniref:Uncharacterized protein n=1 Tax=Asparagus officinalis TaxID=4686 RepID=A0A5P1FSJ4_ASPOF|nr:uncharacterized protein A4U43_C01F20120 [Asparagus officinalis]
MIWTPTARMNAPRHMFKYMTQIDMVDHFPWATIIYKKLCDSFKATKIVKKGQTYLSGYAPLLANEAYDKLMILNEAYEQELVARGVDIMAIKPQIERKDEAEKEEGKKDEAENEGDQGQDMGIELEEYLIVSGFMCLICVIL